MPRTLIASDDFNRADGAVGANWLYIRDTAWQANPPNVTSGQLTPRASGDNYQAIRWAGSGSFSDDQYAKITLQAFSFQTNAYRVGVIVRCSADTNTAADYYSAWVADNAANGSTKTLTVEKRVNGTKSTLLTHTSTTWTNGDTLSLEVEGTTLRVYKNDVQVGSDITDSSLSTGKPGALVAGGGNVPAGDNWEGGDVSSAVANRPKRSMLLGIG